MALTPTRVKHRKQHRGRQHGKATRGNAVAFGEFGLQALEMGWISSRQIEAGRNVLCCRAGRIGAQGHTDRSRHRFILAARERPGAGGGNCHAANNQTASVCHVR